MTHFVKSHLSISRARYGFMKAQGAYESDPSFTLEEREPNYTAFRMLLDRVGGPWGWNRRPKYRAERKKVEDRLKDPETRLFLLQVRGKTVGYCLASLPEEGFADTIEIENFGLFPEHTGKGYGGRFLPMVFGALFGTYGNVYLSTRSTNHAKVVPFYEKLGMTVTRRERLPDDLVPDVPAGAQPKISRVRSP